MSTSANVASTSASSALHADAALRETTVATAEVAPRGAVVAEARVETHAGDHLAEAEAQRRLAAEAAAGKANAHLEHENARPGAHAKHVIGDIGDKIGAKIDEGKSASALKKHEAAANSEEQRAHHESIADKERAREQAKREAEAKAAGTNHASIVSEHGNGKEFVVVAEVPARGGTTGTGAVTSHADDHLVRAANERALAADAAMNKEAAEARLAGAHPGAEAKASVGGIGHKIGAKLHEAKEWMSEKVHDKKADSAEHKGEKELERDVALAREKALRAAEAEAARQDRGAEAHVTSEKTTTEVVTGVSASATKH